MNALFLATSLALVSDYRMSMASFRVLLDVHLNNGDLSMKELAINTSMYPATLTGVADTLEKLGLVKRTPERKDRRIIRIQTTKRGEEFLAEVMSTAPQKP